MGQISDGSATWHQGDQIPIEQGQQHVDNFGSDTRKPVSEIVDLRGHDCADHHLRQCLSVAASMTPYYIEGKKTLFGHANDRIAQRADAGVYSVGTITAREYDIDKRPSMVDPLPGRFGKCKRGTRGNSRYVSPR
jgi:hypothetical protein